VIAVHLLFGLLLLGAVNRLKACPRGSPQRS
jgi:hypothetical protein